MDSAWVTPRIMNMIIGDNLSYTSDLLKLHHVISNFMGGDLPACPRNFTRLKSSSNSMLSQGSKGRSRDFDVLAALFQ
jgi:hypothetical protein